MEDMLLAAAHAVSRTDRAAAQACADQLLEHPSLATATRAVQAGQRVVHQAMRDAWQRGWQPVDLVAVTRSRRSDAHVALLADGVLAESAGYAPSTLDPHWRDQLDALRGDAGEPEPRGAGAWLLLDGRRLDEAIVLAIELTALIWLLPTLPQLLPLPGQARPEVRHRVLDDVDRRQLTRIRALLAKAESTQFPEEAEALSAKAQELMSRHAIERIMLEAATHTPADESTARRLWLDAPYAGAKALLVSSVASANSCRAVWAEYLGCVTVVGAPSDLASVEMLATSLLVQANRAMLAEGQVRDARGTSRTRSFRQSFLVSYATRIGERLQEASAGGVAEAAKEYGGSASLLPVLAAREERAEAASRAMFPHLVSQKVSVSSAEGWAAGHAAADAAVFDTHRQVAEGRRPA